MTWFAWRQARASIMVALAATAALAVATVTTAGPTARSACGCRS